MIFTQLSIYSELALSLFFFLIGLCFGSFFNVLIDRLPQELSINGRSRCESCHKILSFVDLIPVVSYIILKGKCRYCHDKLSLQYPLVEMFTGVVFTATFIYGSYFNYSLIQSFGYFLLLSSCIVIVIADYKYHIIPDQATILFILAGLLIGKGGSIVTQIGGGVILLLILLSIYLITKGKMMGFGDVKLAFGMGILLGIHDGLVALYLSFLIGGLFSMGLLLSGASKLRSKIAFGPFMISGSLVMLFLSTEVNEVIQKMF